MAKIALPEDMRDAPAARAGEIGGPFITISREPGCWGFSLALLLQELLNELKPPGRAWRLYRKEILERLAEQTHLDIGTLDDEQRRRPSHLTDFFYTFSNNRPLSGYEIRNRITGIIRSEAAKGYAIFIGQGAAGATSNMPLGMAVRLEAPEEWRTRQVAFRDGVTLSQARHRLAEMQHEQEYLRKIYDMRFPRKPACHLMFDCSAFTLAQIAQQVVFALKLRGLVS